MLHSSCFCCWQLLLGHFFWPFLFTLNIQHRTQNERLFLFICASNCRKFRWKVQIGYKTVYRQSGRSYWRIYSNETERTMWKVFLTSTIWWESTSYSASLPLIRICISASDSHARVEREGPLHRGCKSQSHQKKIKKIKKRWHLFLQRRQWTSSIPSVAVARAKRGQTKCWKSTKLFQSRLFFMETAWI